MPQLQFDFNKNLTENQKDELCSFVSALFSQIMQTGTDHIGILIRKKKKKKAVRITPPLTITKKDLKIGCEIILQILDKIWLVLISLLRSLNCLIEFKTNHIYF